jgi:4-hydroxy-4-methyl-2-oxoglutarate aldolase
MSTDELIAAELLELGAATLGESGGRPMRARLRAVWSGATLAARALPVACTSADNLAIHVAVANAPAGVAIVASVGTEPERGYWGEVLTIAAQSRGIAGLVIDGCVRDVAQLEHHRFPVFSTGIALPGATKQHPGTVGAPAVVGEVEVHVDDWVVGDRDGVTVVPGDALHDVLAAGRARAEKEARFFAELRAGRTTIELLGIDPSPVRRR